MFFSDNHQETLKKKKKSVLLTDLGGTRHARGHKVRWRVKRGGERERAGVLGPWVLLSLGTKVEA